MAAEKKVKAILFDTRSIQKYIFSGNKLRTNIGASYIVDQVFETELVEHVLKKHQDTLEVVDSKSWRKTTGKIEIESLPAPCYVAYIGGGNALVLFTADISDAFLKSLVTEFTEHLLVTYPGLKTGAAMGSVDLSSQEAYKSSLKELHTMLKTYQGTVFPTVNVPYTGLTLPCEVNGETANFYGVLMPDTETEKEKRWYSQEVWAKTKASTAANDRMHSIFKKELQGYRFPMELNALGQRDGEQDIAIVHIDGNQMGVRFHDDGDTLAKYSALAWQVKYKTERSFAKLIEDIVAEYDTYADYLDLVPGYLPIRPLILGGDDVTFICAARVAITYAKRFMHYMDEDDGIITVGKSSRIKSCGGVAILPEAYPFFRGYELAEQLCDAAKEKSRKQPSSWLDFAILHGEQAPTLSQIRSNEYTGAIGKAGGMHFGPYRVDDNTDVRALDKVLDCAKLMHETLPQSKIKDMRTVLQLGEHDIFQYMEQLQHLNQTIPHIDGWDVYEKDLWYGTAGASEQTPYVDAIELIDYIPLVKGVK